MQNRLVSRSLFVVAASLSVVAVGCGATGGASDGAGRASGAEIVSSGVAPEAQQASYLAQAAKTTGDVSTEKVHLTIRTEGADGGPTSEVTLDGELDAAAGRAHVSSTIAGGPDSGDDADGMSLEAVYDGDTAYLKAPFTADLGADKPWVKVTSPKLRLLADQLAGGLESDPGSFIELLEGAGGPVKTVGTEDVRGVPTRHVTVQLDVAELLDQASGEHRPQLEDQLTKHGVDLDALKPLPAEAWVDDDGYVRRLSVAFDLAQLGQAHPGSDSLGVITETIELYDFDQPVDIAIPPADQVTTIDLGDLLGSGPGHGKGGN